MQASGNLVYTDEIIVYKIKFNNKPAMKLGHK